MSRSISLLLRQALAAPETGEALLVLLTVSHASFTTVRYVNNTESVTSGGQTFLGYAFNAVLPADMDSPAEVPLVIDAVDPTFARQLLAVTGARPGVQMDVVTSSTPDTVEATFSFEAKDMAVDNAAQLQMTLAHEPILSQPYPGILFDAARFPDIFD